MKVSLKWRALVTLVIVILGLVYVLPSFPSVRNSALGKILPDDVINLGLDLKGGIHLTLDVDTQKALDNSLAQLGHDIRDVAKEEENITVLSPKVETSDILEVTLLRKADEQKFDAFLKDRYGYVLTTDSKIPEKGNKVLYRLEMTSDYKAQQAKMTVDQALKTIRNRIDEFGVSEPDIRRQQGGRIQVQLPGLQDPERAIAIIGKTAHLEFKIVDDTVNPEEIKAGTAKLPAGRELLVMEVPAPNGEVLERPIVVMREAAMTGEHITDAKTNFDQFNQPYVSMSFDATGTRRFTKVTEENTKKRMAIVLDGKVTSAPTIQERISGGRASISGRFTTDEARDLAIVLRAGSLPAPITVLEQRTVGPSLGQESIDQGIKSALIGTALVFIFMVIYYGFGGVVADTVLVLNIILIMAGLASFGATLTLPGIAGIILTIGMAVDANVIIFERIREEIRRGLTPRAAIEEGYARATLTILDANVTTVIAAIILYEYGTGPVRGFAVTLTLGIISSMFTAIFVSRVLFDLYTSRREKLTAISI